MSSKEESMRVVTILGSPKKKGNTNKVLSLAEELIAREHEVDRINIIDYEVRGCRGCGACERNPDEPACVQKDDAEEIFQRMLKADALIYATPLYCWSFTAQMKAFLDRHFCLVTGYGTPNFKSLMADKPIALLLTCAGPVEQNADVIQTIFDRMGGYLQCSEVGKYIVPGCTRPEELGEAAEETAKRVAADISGVLR
jgi:multimeric flavodoxin WrbA